MDFRILGPLEVDRNGTRLTPKAAKQRTLLAILLLQTGEVVSNDRLIDGLWGSLPPETANNALQVYVAQLRKLLDPDRGSGATTELLVTRPGGYMLRVPADSIDAGRFEGLVDRAARARGEGNVATAAEKLHEALNLWRGDALADFTYEPFAQAEIARLDELRLAAREQRIDVDLDLGRHAELVGELEGLVRDHPLREHFRGQLMLALYRSGRQADALEAYRETHRVLAEELGIAPGLALRQLETAILRHDPDLDLREEPAEAVRTGRPAAPSTRKNVTVLTLGRTPHPDADPETVRGLDERHLAAVSAVVERHGGSVENVLGDTVMAVFGIPLVHEDDPLRAARAAVELRDRGVTGSEPGPAANSSARLRAGIATGEVVTGGAGETASSLAGTPLTHAGQLEAAASPGEIIVADATRELLGDSVGVAPIGDSRSEGWRLLDVFPARPPLSRPPQAPMVGREPELASLREALDRAVAGETRMVTILGPAGIGKSRLVEELAAGAVSEANVLAGRCVPYGEGITFWAMAEIVRQIGPADRLGEILATTDDGDQAAARVREAVGLSPESSGREEIFQAFRVLFERLADERPVLLVIEDIHWAEPSFLDLIEFLAGGKRTAPILFVCLARDELVDKRSGWGDGPNASALELSGLDEPESNSLIATLGGDLGEATRSRLREAAEGNPLFLEQMVALVDSGERTEAEMPIPPSIQAVLASRLDRLGPGERALIRRAAVAGKEFSASAVEQLLPGDARPFAARHLDALCQKSMVMREAQEGDREAFRFAHALIHQAAYREIPKRLRATLHQDFAGWIEAAGGGAAADPSEIAGYHLEQAYLYRAELDPADDESRELARGAANRLASAGARALQRGDMPAAAGVIGRAASLLPANDRTRLELLPDLGLAMFETGEIEAASRVLAEALERARAAGDSGLEWRAVVRRTHVHMCMDPASVDLDQLRRDGNQAVEVLGRLHDDSSLATAWTMLADGNYMRGELGETIEAASHAADHARRAGNRRAEARALGEGSSLALLYGPTPVSESRRRLEAVLDQEPSNPLLQASLPAYLAVLEAMSGEFDSARAGLTRSLDLTRQLGLTLEYGVQNALGAEIEMLAGDSAAAERYLRTAGETMTEIGDTWWGAIVAVDLPRAVYEQGRLADAAALCEAIDDVPAPADLEWQIKRGRIRARVLADLGRIEEAEELAREAAATAAGTEFVPYQAGALLDLAEVLTAASRETAALEVATQSLELNEGKENRVSAEAARALVKKLLP